MTGKVHEKYNLAPIATVTYYNIFRNCRFHGNVSETFWIWVEDPQNNYIYHHEYFIITKRQVCFLDAY